MSQPEPAAEAEYTHLGAYFKSLREHYELDVNQVAARLHIRAKYIEALEAGDMASLPGKVYTQGYIHSYAEFLGLDPVSVVAQYEGVEPSPALKFRIIEPTEQSGMPAWRYIALGAVAALLIYGLVSWIGSSPSAEPLEQRIEPVPERLAKPDAPPLILTEQNRACLSLTLSPEALPCYYRGGEAPNPAFVMDSVRSIMELPR